MRKTFLSVMIVLLVILIGFGAYSAMNPTMDNVVILVAGLIILLIIYIVGRSTHGRKGKPRDIEVTKTVKVKVKTE